MTREEAARIVAASATLAERLSQDPPGILPGHDFIHEERMFQWKKMLGQDRHANRLARRVALAGWEAGSEERAAADFRAPSDGLPPWSATLEAMLQSLAVDPDESAEWHRRVGDPSIPFGAILAGAAHFGLAELQAQVASSAWARMAEPAQMDLGLVLLRSLSSAASSSLMEHFDSFRAAASSTLIQGGDSHPVYAAFISEMKRGGWTALLKTAPVLGRLLTLVFEQWLRYGQGFLERLEADAETLERDLGARGKIISLSTMSGRMKEGSCTALCVAFSNGGRLAYKPRDVSCDRAFFEMVAQLNAAMAAEVFAAPSILDRGGYGWMPWFTPEPCQSAHQIECYYKRAGHLLALLYALGSTDAHYENIVASRNCPVLVDGETVFGAAHESTGGSVLRTGLLPVWREGKNGASYDTSGLGAKSPHDTGHLERIIAAPNTDAMHFATEPKLTAPEANLPWLHGRRVSCRRQVEAVVAGFGAGYRFIQEHRKEFIGARGFMEKLGELQTRCPVRASHVYAFVLHKLKSPPALRDGFAWSLELERLARLYLSLDDETAARCWKVFESESEALQQFEVPRFYVSLTTAKLLDRKGRLVAENFLPASPRDLICSMIENLGEEDRKVQEDIIRQSIKGRWEKEPA